MIRITRPLTTTPAPAPVWSCDLEDFIIITIIYRSNYIVLAGRCEGGGLTADPGPLCVAAVAIVAIVRGAPCLPSD